ncbi:DUF4962 domain-containing protein [Ruficoccus sp. ZRK36]|uniref:DUF4962 domain-containing protein n=1 Tax=Ruficoccus sp. ZRK36 TaxID=2866311 RepID=UPI001C72D51A|nr:DUF4962 domain-containing protein [Ruficoccus sp. ZRK36]QYY37272.1 DUF4962 domain-containing protein [Ruficoccus sp. ZRK36]
MALLLCPACGGPVSPSSAASSPAPSADAATPAEGQENAGFAVRPELAGGHPRLFVDEVGLQSAQERFRQDRGWAGAYFPADGPELSAVPKPVTGKSSSVPCKVIGKLAVGYAVTGQERYLERLKLWLPVLEKEPPLEIKGIGARDNNDLACGYILAGLAISYDVLEGRVDAQVSDALRDLLIKQASQTYHDLRAIKHYPYEQNHFSIPVGGLLVASMALLGEYPEATEWAQWSSEMMARCLHALAPDGWFFEGMNYWGYTLQFPVTGALALRHVTGEDLFEIPFMENTGLYFAHSYLPGRDFVFDFGDWGPRVNQDGKTAQRGYEKPWHTHPTRVPKFIPYVLDHERPDPRVEQLVTRWNSGGRSLDGMVGALLQIPAEAGKSVVVDDKAYPPYHYFDDEEVIHWRGSWNDPQTTAIAFKSGPPGGHAMAELLKQYPDWKPSLGHAHPDAGSFILFSKGAFLANDTGYAVKETAWHNSILVDGVGQEQGGTAFTCFKYLPYDKLNKIRMDHVLLGPQVAAGQADFKAAYSDSFGLEQMQRDLMLVGGHYLVVRDLMAAAEPHQYEWLLHGDREAQPLGEGRYTMTNGDGRLVIQNLGPIVDAQIAPTIVETELYELKTRSRPQQRGYHLAMTSETSEQAGFLTAMLIQATTDDPAAFEVEQVTENKLVMSDGSSRCIVWLGGSEELEGAYAYVLYDAEGQAVSAGLQGEWVESAELSLELDTAGSLTLERDSESGTWSTSSCSEHTKPVMFSLNGKPRQVPPVAAVPNPAP